MWNKILNWLDPKKEYKDNVGIATATLTSNEGKTYKIVRKGYMDSWGHLGW